MALATLPVNIARTVTDKRIATDVIRSHGFLDQWWTTVHGMSFPDPATPANRHIRPRIGSVDLRATGAVPFAASGYRPATFNGAGPHFLSEQAYAASGIYSMILSCTPRVNGDAAAGLRQSVVGIRPVQNGAPAVVVSNAIAFRPTSLVTSLGAPVTLAVVLDFANEQAAIAMNGGPFVSGAADLPGSSPNAPPAVPQSLIVGGHGATSVDVFDGEMHEFAFAVGKDLRTNIPLWQDFAAYTASIWGA